MLEADIVRKIQKWLAKQDCWWGFKVHGHPRQAKGVPDIVGSWMGLFVGIEVKQPNRREEVTKYQYYQMEKIRAAGGIAFVACSLAEVKKELLAIERS